MTNTITPEAKAILRDVQGCAMGWEPDARLLGNSRADEIYTAIEQALTALEASEARAEKAEKDKAALEEDLEAAEKNLKELSGFIEELLSGLKRRFPVQYADLRGDEYDAFSSHDLFKLVIDPAVNAAQKAERDKMRAAVLSDALKGTIGPLELYHAYGWADRDGVIRKAKDALKKLEG